MAKAEQTLHFDLVLLGFPNLTFERAVAALARAFAIAPERAQEYIYKTPVTVVTGAPQDILKSYVQALHSLGADLQVTCVETEELWFLRTKDTEVKPERTETPVTLALINDELSEDDTGLSGDVSEILCPYCGKTQFSGRLCQNCGRAIGLPTEGVAGPLPQFTGEVAAVPEGEPLLAAELPSEEESPPQEMRYEPEEPDEKNENSDKVESADLGIRTYSLPDFTGAQAAAVGYKATGEFFVTGRKGRPFVETGDFGPQKKKKKRVVKFDRHGKAILPSKDKKRKGKKQSTADTTRRERAALIVILLSLAVVLVYVLIQVLEFPQTLTHESAGREFSVVLPPGYNQVESREGVLNTRIGSVPYSVHSARKRDDPVGALLFTSLELHPDVFRRNTEERILNDTLEVVVEEHQGFIAESHRVDGAEYYTIDATYRTERFGKDYEGLVRIMSVDGAVIVLVCEGTGWACQNHEHSHDFFSSFEIGEEED